MRILVCVKQVPDPEHFPVGQYTKDMRLARGSFPRTANPVDKNACELALQLAGDDPIEVVTMGPSEAKEALRELLAMGAHEATHVCDPKLEGADIVTTALVLAAAIKKRGTFDLVVCGKQSTDAGNSSVPAVLAEMLDVPCAVGAERVSFEGEVFLAHVPSDRCTTVWRMDLPAVVSVTKNINTPRLPSLRGMTKAINTPINEFDLSTLELDLLDVRLTNCSVVDSKTITKEVSTTIFEGETPQVKAKALIDALRGKGVLA